MIILNIIIISLIVSAKILSQELLQGRYNNVIDLVDRHTCIARSYDAYLYYNITYIYITLLNQ